MPTIDLTADFSAFQDNAVLPDEFQIGNFFFRNLSRPGTLFVNQSRWPGGVILKGLQGRSPVHFLVRQPAGAEAVRAKVAVFSGISIIARADAGREAAVDVVWDGENRLEDIEVALPGLREIEFDTGAEGLLLELRVRIEVAG